MLRTTLLALLVALPAPALADLGDEGVGVNTHVPDDSTLDLVVELGADWVRVDANWFQLQPRPDAFDWGFMDEVVERAHGRGLRVYLTLAYTPAWVPRIAERHPDGNAGNDEPASSAEWVAFVDAAVRRYAARGVTHYGLWNEPNLDHFWDGDADGYVDTILAPGADAVRRACGECVVLGPDLAHVGDYDVFLDRVLARGIGSFDIVAHHIYQGWPETGTEVWDGDRFLEALEMRRASFTRASLREVLDRHGWTGEVWITETGYRATPGDSGDEATQATYVRRVLEEQYRRDWWTNTFFYEAVDCVPFLPTCDIDGFGITRANHAGERRWPGDYRAKPAFAEIQGFLAAHPPGEAPPGIDAGVSALDAGRADAGAPERDAGARDAGALASSDAAPPSETDAGGAGPTASGCAIGAGRGAPLGPVLVALALLGLRESRKSS